MSKAKNPWDIPEWHFIRREAVLARQLIGSGVTALGKANYANGKGEYYTAFFGISVGLERLTKLILVVDHALSNSGKMPSQQMVSKFGHNLLKLMAAADEVAVNNNLQLRYTRPTSVICTKIIECLDAFADASRGRYANFAALGDPNLGTDNEPINKWWGEVAELILQKHFYGTPAQARAEARAGQIEHLLSENSSVLYMNEQGRAMEDIFSSSLRTRQTEYVQKFGRYYALTIVRWLSCLFSTMCKTASNDKGIDAFYGAWEFFYTYTVDDSFLMNRKRWPLGA